MTPIEKKVDQFAQDTKLISEQYHEFISPYHGKYKNQPKDSLVIQIGSDFHGRYMDPFCRHVFIESAKKRQPDVIFLNGDIVDFFEISDHDKAELYWLWGNHERRLFRFLCKNRALASLRSLQFGTLFELDRLRINLVARHNFVTQTKKKDRDIARPYMIFGDKAVLITHGTKLSKWHTGGESQSFGHTISIVTGHTHRPQYMTMTKFDARRFAMSLGTLASLVEGENHGEDFMIDPIIDWGQSFANILVYKSDAIPEHFIFGEHFCQANGYYYLRDSDGRSKI